MAILNSYLLQNLANDGVGFISISLKKKKNCNQWRSNKTAIHQLAPTGGGRVLDGNFWFLDQGWEKTSSESANEGRRTAATSAAAAAQEDVRTIDPLLLFQILHDLNTHFQVTFKYKSLPFLCRLINLEISEALELDLQVMMY